MPMLSRQLCTDIPTRHRAIGANQPPAARRTEERSVSKPGPFVLHFLTIWYKCLECGPEDICTDKEVKSTHNKGSAMSTMTEISLACHPPPSSQADTGSNAMSTKTR